MDAQRKIVNIDDVKPLGSRKKQLTTFLVLGIIVLIVVAIGLAFAFGGKGKITSIKSYTTSKVEEGTLVLATDASGTVVVPAKVSIASPADGYAGAVYVSEGDTVTTSTILAVIRVPDLEDELETQKSQLNLAKLNLTDTITDYDYSIKSYKINLQRLDEQIVDAKKEVETQKDLAALSTSNNNSYDTAVDALKTLQEKRDDTQMSLDKELSHQNTAIAKQQESIKLLQTTVNRLYEDISSAKIRSPIPGEVLDISDSLLIEGNLIAKNTALITVANRKLTYVDLEVNEEYAVSLKEGQEIEVTVGSTTFTAQITQVGKTAVMSSDGLTATVSVRTKPIDDVTLTPGASAVATLNLGSKEKALTLPRGAWLTTGNQKYVFKVEGNKAYKTEITVGEIQGTKVEILTGLKNGDIVITSGYQDYLASASVELK